MRKLLRTCQVISSNIAKESKWFRKSGGGKGYLTDGPLSYSASARCIWIVESDTPGPILFRLEDFLTECCWDHLYIYDGDGVYNKLIAAFRYVLPL